MCLRKLPFSTAISADNYTLTLVNPIRYQKLSSTVNYTGNVSAMFAAEVGLLTRNVVIRGDNNSAVPSSLPECIEETIRKFGITAVEITTREWFFYYL